MEIKLNTNVDPITRPSADPSQARKQPAATDQTGFDQSSRLEESLAATPEVRPEVVQRGKEFISQTTYPPPETIRKIAELLAIQFEDTQGERPT